MTTKNHKLKIEQCGGFSTVRDTLLTHDNMESLASFVAHNELTNLQLVRCDRRSLIHSGALCKLFPRLQGIAELHLEKLKLSMQEVCALGNLVSSSINLRRVKVLGCGRLGDLVTPAVKGSLRMAITTAAQVFSSALRKNTSLQHIHVAPLLFGGSAVDKQELLDAIGGHSRLQSVVLDLAQPGTSSQTLAVCTRPIAPVFTVSTGFAREAHLRHVDLRCLAVKPGHMLRSIDLRLIKPCHVGLRDLMRTLGDTPSLSHICVRTSCRHTHFEECGLLRYSGPATALYLEVRPTPWGHKVYAEELCAILASSINLQRLSISGISWSEAICPTLLRAMRAHPSLRQMRLQVSGYRLLAYSEMGGVKLVGSQCSAKDTYSTYSGESTLGGTWWEEPGGADPEHSTAETDRARIAWLDPSADLAPDACHRAAAMLHMVTQQEPLGLPALLAYITRALYTDTSTAGSLAVLVRALVEVTSATCLREHFQICGLPLLRAIPVSALRQAGVMDEVTRVWRRARGMRVAGASAGRTEFATEGCATGAAAGDDQAPNDALAASPSDHLMLLNELCLELWQRGQKGRCANVVRWRTARDAHRDAELVFQMAGEGRPMELAKRLRLGKLAGGLVDRRRDGSGAMVTALQAAMAGGHVECEAVLRDAEA